MTQPETLRRVGIHGLFAVVTRIDKPRRPRDPPLPSHQFETCRDVDRVFDAAGHGAVVGMGAVGAVDRLAVGVLGAGQVVRHVDPLYDQDFAVLLNLANRFRGEGSV